MFETVADCHCHIDVRCTESDAERTAHAIASARDFRNGFFSIMTTYDRDRLLLETMFDRLGTAQNKLMPYWGVHPWYSHLFSFGEDGDNLDGSLKERHYNSVLVPPPTARMMAILPEPIDMKRHLVAMRGSIRRCTPPHGKFGIGEIGLDKLFRVPSSGFYGSTAATDPSEPRLSPCKVSMEHQERILQCQLALAAECGAPVSIHCVKAHGRLFAAMKDYPGPTVILHSYTGSVDQARMWVRKADKSRQQLFFSFSQWINGEKSRQLHELLEALRDEHILVESDVSIDRHDLGSYKEEHIRRIVETVCEIRRWESLDALDENIRRAIGVGK